jgi:uncharacterized membrane protein (UPF0127 family)
LIANSGCYEQGLSDRNEIGSDGMLFILPSKTIPAFWMKDMRFPLDFVWIDGNVVVDISEHVSNPAPNTQQKDLSLYRPKQAVTHVLELPDGAVNRYTLKIGDAVQYGVRYPYVTCFCSNRLYACGVLAFNTRGLVSFPLITIAGLVDGINPCAR